MVECLKLAEGVAGCGCRASHRWRQGPQLGFKMHFDLLGEQPPGPTDLGSDDGVAGRPPPRGPGSGADGIVEPDPGLDEALDARLERPFADGVDEGERPDLL